LDANTQKPLFQKWQAGKWAQKGSLIFFVASLPQGTKGGDFLKMLKN
jgi:hypothetical protein